MITVTPANAAAMASSSLTAAVAGRRALSGTAAAFSVLVVAQVLGSASQVHRTSEVLQVLAAGMAAVTAGAAARRSDGRARLFWSMVAVSAVAWAAGHFHVTGQYAALAPARSTGWQRGLFLSAVFPLGVAGLMRPDRPGAGRAVLVLDAAMLTGLMLFAYAYIGASVEPGEGGFQGWRRIATLAQAVVAAAALAPLLVAPSPEWRPTYRYVTWAVLVWFGGNAVLSAAYYVGAYRAGVMDLPWVLPFVWLSAAADGWRPIPSDAQSRELWRERRRALVQAMAIVGVVPVLHLTSSLVLAMPLPLWHGRTRLTLMALVTLGALFAVRQYLVVRRAEATERARVLAIARVDARFHQAFSHSPAAMAMVRLGDLRVLDANARCGDLLDLPPEAIVGARTADVLIRMPDAAESLEDVLRAARARRGFPVRFHTRAGALVECLMSIEPIDVEGEPAALLLMEDVRERKGLEEQLVNAQKMDAIGRLAGGIAHEFNNLLTAIMNAASLARADVHRPAAVDAHLTGIDRASQRAATLTRQLLAFGRRQALRPEPLDLASVLDEMRLLLPSVLGEDVDLDVHSPAHLPKVRADRAQVKQVILNLAANARDAMPRGGRLSIALAEVASDGGPGAGTEVQLSVRDEGEGMNEQVQAHLFEPFFTTRDPGARGGLGLAAVYGIVAQSGGRIAVESHPGHGTVVTMRFPAMPGEPA